MTRFNFQRLIVYQRAIGFAVFAHQLLPEIARGQGDLRDQLARASISVPLNIAEGSGEFSQAEKLRFYRMARRSGTECAAILDVLEAIEVMETQRLERGRLLLDEIVAMLTTMTLKKEKEG